MSPLQEEAFEEILQACVDLVESRSRQIKRGFAELLRQPEQRVEGGLQPGQAAVYRSAKRQRLFDDFNRLPSDKKRRVLKAVEDNVRPESSLDTWID